MTWTKLGLIFFLPGSDWPDTVRPAWVANRFCIFLYRNANKITSQILFGFSPGRSVLKNYFFIELGLKIIPFKIQFKTKPEIFIQKNIHSIESRIFIRIIHSKHMGWEYVSREKKLPMVNFLIFVHKNIYRIRFQEIKIIGWEGFEKITFPHEKTTF